MSWHVVVRKARAGEWAARADLVRAGYNQHRAQAFLLFFFQELTVQCCVLGGAVLFIFCGLSVTACLVLLPAAAIVVALGVAMTHLALADKHAQRIREEMSGLVAEVVGPLLLAGDQQPPSTAVHIHPYIYTTQDMCDATRIKHDGPVHRQIIGTVSISEWWGARRSGFVHALAVHPRWRRVGVGRALVSGVRAEGVGLGLESLEAVVSQLQDAARSLLHAAGWECRGSYQRQLCGAALTLLLANFATDLPHA